MKPASLKPIRDRQVYTDIVAKKIEWELYSRIFQPILEIFGVQVRHVAPGRTNAKEKRNDKGGGLVSALKSGTVTFLEGYFYGYFTASISKEIASMGGRFNKRQKAWKADLSKMPIQVTQAISQAREASRERVTKANQHLDKLEKEGIGTIDLNEITQGVLQDLKRQFNKTTAEKLEIPMAMEGFIASELQRDYHQNMDLYIKGWVDEAIVRLRGQIQENSMSGYRAKNMEVAIINEYDVTKNKAKFLARQETSLLVSKYREANYKEAGIPAYMWSTSQDRRVRQDHRDLNGKIFRWDSPPVVDKARGRTGHPGEDFGCRCVAIPILPSQLHKESA